MRQPRPLLAPVDAEALEAAADVGRERGGTPLVVVQREHAGAARLAIAADAEQGSCGRCRRGAQFRCDRGSLPCRPRTEEREGDVQVLGGDDASVQLALLPVHELPNRGVRKLEGAEQP